MLFKRVHVSFITQWEQNIDINIDGRIDSFLMVLQTGTTTMKISAKILQKLEKYPPYDTAIPLLGISP